jgi:hypothetical protein
METRGSTPSSVLWSPRQIGVAALLGSPLAAGWFFARNYVALGCPDRSRRALWLGVALTAAVAGIGFALPQNFPNAMLPVFYAIALQGYASNRFGTAYQRHLAEGGARGSWWIIVGVGLGASALLVALVVIGVMTVAWWAGADIDWSLRHSGT